MLSVFYAPIAVAISLAVLGLLSSYLASWLSGAFWQRNSSPRISLMNRCAQILSQSLFLFLLRSFSYPLILSFSTHVPGDITDAPALAWNLWWIKCVL
jgi:hypothetical protein